MPISRKELVRRLKRLGFSGPYPGGSHQVMWKGNLRLTIPNPHGSFDINDALLKRILKQAGLTKEEFNKVKD